MFLDVANDDAWAAPIRLWAKCGWCGVDLFFVLSGFLVSGLLFREFQKQGQIALPRFFIRRGFKIYPAFYLLILVTVLVIAAFGGNLRLKSVLSEILFIQNYKYGLWAHTWSLAVEEHFYILLGLVLWRLAKKGGSAPFRVIPKLFVVVAVVELGLRVLVNVSRPFMFQATLYPTHLRLDGLLCGVALSYFKWFHGDFLWSLVGRWRSTLLGLSLLLLSPTLLMRVGPGSLVMNSVGLTTTYLGFAGILLWAYDPNSKPSSRFPLLRKIFATIGCYSYSIYLWHLAMLDVINEVIRHARWVPGPVVMAVYFVLSPLFGIAMAKICELPFLRLRDRLTAETSPMRSAGLGRGRGGNAGT
jgi:peptidoglycan/LPS O-acetylase OafA/YrhL